MSNTDLTAQLSLVVPGSDLVIADFDNPAPITVAFTYCG